MALSFSRCKNNLFNIYSSQSVFKFTPNLGKRNILYSRIGNDSLEMELMKVNNQINDSSNIYIQRRKTQGKHHANHMY